MNGSLYSLTALDIRLALSAFPDEALDEEGIAEMAGVLYLDPAGVLVGVHTESGATVMVKVSTPPRFLFGAMLAFYRVPFLGKVHVVEQDGRWVITDGVGACGLVTKVGARMEWRAPMRWRGGREMMMNSALILPDMAAILHRVQREAGGDDSLTIMQSHSEGFMVTAQGTDCAIWLPIPEAWRNEDTKDARALVDSFNPGKPGDWPKDMPEERPTMRKGPIAQARRRTRCANQK